MNSLCIQIGICFYALTKTNRVLFCGVFFLFFHIILYRHELETRPKDLLPITHTTTLTSSISHLVNDRARPGLYGDCAVHLINITTFLGSFFFFNLEIATEEQHFHTHTHRQATTVRNIILKRGNMGRNILELFEMFHAICYEDIIMIICKIN